VPVNQVRIVLTAAVLLFGFGFEFDRPTGIGRTSGSGDSYWDRGCCEEPTSVDPVYRGRR